MQATIGFLMDPFEQLDSIDEDTSCVLAAECLDRGHRVYYFQSGDLIQRNQRTWATFRQIVGRREDGFVLESPVLEPVDMCDAVFIRKDPPFNQEYLHATLLLDSAAGDCAVGGRRPVRMVNPPHVLRSVNEKLYPLRFPSCAPKTCVTRRVQALQEFLVEVDGSMVVKPLDECSGRGVIRLNRDETSLISSLRRVTDEEQTFVMAQEFLPDVHQGDVRVLMLDGEILGAMRRIPAEGDFRANMHRGASIAPAQLTAAQRALCRRLGPELHGEHIYLAGLDLVGDRLLEVNVTSPAGIPEINRLAGVNLERRVIDWLEELLGGS